MIAAAAAATACGSSEDASQLMAGPADLRFGGAGVEILLPYLATPVTVPNGGSFHVKCDLQGFRARYRYENVGESAAAAHTNASGVAGGAT
jgi:hypothetical protein